MRYLYISLFLSVFALKAKAQIITTVVGNGTSGFSGDGGQATAAELNSPTGIIFDALCNMYIADHDNQRIRMVSTSGTINTVAGNGTAGYSGDGGNAISAELDWPDGLAFDSQGNLYFADYSNQRIRMISTSGTINTVVGNGTGGYSGDGGNATAAEIYNPSGVALDASGNLYIADQTNQRIRMVSTSGTICTVAGNGTAGYSGDGGMATAAELDGPTTIAFDAIGNLYIADYSNKRIRMVSTSGTINTVAGNGTAGYSGDGGNATSAELNYPGGVAIDAAGNLYIADLLNNRIRMVSTSGTINTVAGNGTAGYSGDGGMATAAELYLPTGVAFDATGNLYIIDYHNQRIRMVTNISATNSCAHTTSIKQFANSNEQVTIYPNPATNNLQVSCASNIESSTLILTDMLGNTVKHFTVNSNQLSINVADLNEGVYNILIHNSAVSINKKVVIVR